MKIIKRILLVLFVLVILLVGGFYLYIKSLPTAPPADVVAADLQKQQQDIDFTCSPSGQFNYAYDVTANVETNINNQVIYQSEIKFKTQLSQANGPVIKGVATNISVDEGNGATPVADLTYLSRVEAGQYALFSAYNSLALQRQHPMSIMSQFLKALSVGEEGEAYVFLYDPLQRTYRYQHQAETVERADYPSTYNVQQLSSLFNDYKSNWKVELGDECVPNSLFSEEVQGIAAGQNGGYAKFSITAKLIPTYTDVNNYHYEDIANSANVWSMKEIHVSEFEKPINNTEEMWDAIEEFVESKSVGKLVKATKYMIDNVSVDELSGALSGNEISDEMKRELAFGLGVSGHPEAENYILSTIGTLPSGLADGTEQQEVDLQKVRLMSAAATNGLATSETYRYFDQLLNDTGETNNVHKNALLNMGTVVNQLNQNGGNDSDLESTLRGTIEEQLQSENAATAVLAAGNAKLEGLESQYLTLLSSSNDRERYASGTVLSRDSQNYDQLIEHLSTEQSNLVVNAIVVGMSQGELSSAQRARVQEIQSGAETDKAKILGNLLKN